MLGTLGGWFQINKDGYHLLEERDSERKVIRSKHCMVLRPIMCFLQDLGRAAEELCALNSVATLGYLRMNSEVEILMWVYVSTSIL